MVDAEDFSPRDTRLCLDWLQIGEALDAVEKGAKVLGASAAVGEGGCGWSEDIAAVECVGGVRKPKFAIRDFAGSEGRVVREAQTEHTVIGGDEELPLEFHKQRFACGADTGVDYDDVNCAGRKEGSGLADGIRAGIKRKRWDVVRDVYNWGAGTATQDDAFHGSRVMVLKPKVGGQGNDGRRHALLRL